MSKLKKYKISVGSSPVYGYTGIEGFKPCLEVRESSDGEWYKVEDVKKELMKKRRVPVRMKS